jgi:hypothetical protein
MTRQMHLVQLKTVLVVSQAPHFSKSLPVEQGDANEVRRRRWRREKEGRGGNRRE